MTSLSASGLMATIPSASPTSQSPVCTVTSPTATVPPISPGPDLAAPGRDVPASEDGELHGCKPVQVAHRAVDDERDDACRLRCCGEDLAPIPSRHVARHSDGENAAARRPRHAGMHREVVSDGTADSECRASEARPGPHGVDAGIQPLGAAFAERRAAQLYEYVGNGRVWQRLLCHGHYTNTC